MLQEKILERYRLLYPDQTLQQTSELTGINISRVFRLFNGYEMKLKEFEVFEKVIAKRLGSQHQRCDFIETIIQCLDQLSFKAINEIQTEIKLKLQTKSCFYQPKQKGVS